MRLLWPVARHSVAAISLLASTLALGPTRTAQPDLASLIDAGHFKQARAIVDPRFRADPNDPELLYFEARIKNAFGEREAAIKLAERALELNKSNVYYHGALAQLYGDKAKEANFVEQIVLARKVKGHLEEALALDPKNWRTRDGLVQFYLLAPAIVGGDKSKAQQIADQVVKDDPAHGWLTQARIAQENKDQARQEAAYLNALKADASNFSALIALGNYYGLDKLKRFDLVEKYGREAIRVDPTRSQGYNLVAVAYINTNRIGEVDAVLAQAEKASPDDWSPYYVAARVLINIGQDFDRAERYLRKYMAQEPEGGAPKVAYAHWRLGQMYQKSGKKELALAEYQACLRAEPSFEPAKKDLKSLK